MSDDGIFVIQRVDETAFVYTPRGIEDLPDVSDSFSRTRCEEALEIRRKRYTKCVPVCSITDLLLERGKDPRAALGTQNLRTLRHGSNSTSITQVERGDEPEALGGYSGQERRTVSGAPSDPVPACWICRLQVGSICSLCPAFAGLRADAPLSPGEQAGNCWAAAGSRCFTGPTRLQPGLRRPGRAVCNHRARGNQPSAVGLCLKRTVPHLWTLGRASARVALPSGPRKRWKELRSSAAR